MSGSVRVMTVVEISYVLVKCLVRVCEKSESCKKHAIVEIEFIVGMGVIVVEGVGVGVGFAM